MNKPTYRRKSLFRALNSTMAGRMAVGRQPGRQAGRLGTVEVAGSLHLEAQTGSKGKYVRGF